MERIGELERSDATSTAEEALSHALRTPLTSLTSYLSLLDRRAGSIAATHADDDSLTGLIQLTRPALASALDMRDAIDRALDRHATAAPTALSSGSRTSNAERDTMGDRRFDREWDSWDERLRRGEKQTDILSSLRDKQLAEMLAADAGMRRPLERNVIATALTNRLAKRQDAPADALVRKMARSIASAATTSANTRRLLADSARARAERATRQGAERDLRE